MAAVMIIDWPFGFSWEQVRVVTFDSTMGFRKLYATGLKARHLEMSSGMSLLTPASHLPVFGFHIRPQTVGCHCRLGKYSVRQIKNARTCFLFSASLFLRMPLSLWLSLRMLLFSCGNICLAFLRNDKSLISNDVFRVIYRHSPQTGCSHRIWAHAKLIGFSAA